MICPIGERVNCDDVSQEANQGVYIYLSAISNITVTLVCTPHIANNSYLLTPTTPSTERSMPLNNHVATDKASLYPRLIVP